MYQYKAIVERVVDGDTLLLTIDLGFTVQWKSTCRLYGINTPELNSKDQTTRMKALEAKQFLIDLLPVGSEVVINSKSLDKYGRPLAEVFFKEININQELISVGHAVKYLL